MVAGVSTLSAFFCVQALIPSWWFTHHTFPWIVCVDRFILVSFSVSSLTQKYAVQFPCLCVVFRAGFFFFLISNFLALWLEKILGLITVFEKFVETYFVACHMIYPGDFSMCWLRMYIPQLLSRVFFDVAWLDVSLMMFSSLKVESESYTVTVY